MTDTLDDAEDHQPPITLFHMSFTRGELEGKPCVVIFDESTEKTTVIGFQSRGYVEALMALAVLEQCSMPLPNSLKNQKTIVHRKPKLILPGSISNN